MQDKLLKLKQQMLEELEKATTGELLRDLEKKYLGRKGELTGILKSIAELAENERKELGMLANGIKMEMIKRFKDVEEGLQASFRSDETYDMTIPGEKRPIGHVHPISQVQAELEDLFTSMGFMVLEGPELESDFFCFEALNIPAFHPARDTQDTFYIDRKNKQGQYDLVMRTHTSPMQVRAMKKYGAPLRCVVPGRVFRAEATDAVHEHTFGQLEGLMIDKNITIANLIAVMKELLKGVFGREMEVRIRPGYFPFVEPGIELDIKCTICGGSGCPSCKHSGWLELLPAGMVHPKVLEYGGIDPNKYSGFAFGLGLTRLVMMKYGIGDIRLFNSGDLRFLEQF
jgi:phenylalanyl-tRNA synthetase alpha chain